MPQKEPRLLRRTLIAAASITMLAACTSPSESQPAPTEENSGPFGPDPDFPDPHINLQHYSSSLDLESLRKDLTDGLEADGFRVITDHWPTADALPDDVQILSIEPLADLRETMTQYPALNLVIPFRIQLSTGPEGASALSYFDPEGLASAVAPGDQAVSAAIADAWHPIRDAIENGSDGGVGATEKVPLTLTMIDTEVEHPIEFTRSLGTELYERQVDALFGESTEDDSRLIIAPRPESYVGYQTVADTPFTDLAVLTPVYVWRNEFGFTVGYFDPFPLLRTIDSDLIDAGFELSSLYSEAAWDASGMWQ